MIAFAMFMSLALAVLGAYCLFAPREIQAYALKHRPKGLLSDSSSDWMNTSSYLLYLRLLGGAAFISGGTATVILATIWFKTWFI